MHDARRLWERVQIGEDGWFYTLEEDGHPSAPMSDEPFCTRSQILAYRDDEARQIARVHRYLREDGSIGASGKPDPKQVLGEDGVLYVAFEPPHAEDG